MNITLIKFKGCSKLGVKVWIGTTHFVQSKNCCFERQLWAAWPLYSKGSSVPPINLSLIYKMFEIIEKIFYWHAQSGKVCFKRQRWAAWPPLSHGSPLCHLWIQLQFFQKILGRLPYLQNFVPNNCPLVFPQIFLWREKKCGQWFGTVDWR